MFDTLIYCMVMNFKKKNTSALWYILSSFFIVVQAKKLQLSDIYILYYLKERDFLTDDYFDNNRFLNKYEKNKNKNYWYIFFYLLM
jgi:hypothetical protein